MWKKSAFDSRFDDCLFNEMINMVSTQLPDVSTAFEVYHLEVCTSVGKDVLMIAGVSALSCRATEL